MRVDGDVLHTLIGHIYDSVAEPGALGDVLRAVAGWLDARSAVLFTPTLPPAHGGLGVLHEHDPATIARYCEYYFAVDVWHAGGQARAGGGPMGIVTGAELVSRERFERSEFYNDFLRPDGIEDVIATDIAVGAAGRRLDVSLAFHAGRRHRGFDADDKALLATLVPHLRRALQLSIRMGGAFDAMRRTVEALDGLADGVLLLAADGALLHATPAARACLDAGHGLRVRAGRLCAWLARDDAALAAALAHAAPARGAPSGGTVAVRSPQSQQPLVVSIFPLPPREPPLAAAAARILVILRDPARAPATCWEVFAQHFGITPAELRLCQALADDVTLPDYCARHALSDNTARSQLKSVFSKTGVRRQSELLRLIRAFG